MEEKRQMRHEKEAILQALAELQVFSNDKKYQDNLTVVYEYIEDVVVLMQQYKQIGDTAIRSLATLTEKIEAVKKMAPQDHKQK